GNQPCRFPRRASDTLCLCTSCCSCTGRPNLADHPSSVYLSSSQKNASHFEKHLISEPVQTSSPPGFVANTFHISKKGPSRFVILSAAKDLSPDRDPSLRS